MSIRMSSAILLALALGLVLGLMLGYLYGNSISFERARLTACLDFADGRLEGDAQQNLRYECLRTYHVALED